MPNPSLEDQIRNYTDAWFQTVTPAEQLAARSETAERTIPGQITVSVPRTSSQAGPWKGLAVAFGAALIVLLAALPSLLSRSGSDSAATTNPPVAPTSTVAQEDNIFLGVWTGEDSDGSWNILIVEEDTATYQETGLTACKITFDQYVGGQATGSATVEGNKLTFTGTLYCNLEEGRTPHPSYISYEWVINYDPESGTVMLGNDPNATLSR